MIVDAVLSFLGACASWVIGLVPDFDAPSWADPAGIVDGLAPLISAAAYMGNWVPWSTILAVLAAVWVVYAGSSAVQVVLKIYAIIRGGAT